MIVNGNGRRGRAGWELLGQYENIRKNQEGGQTSRAHFFLPQELICPNLSSWQGGSEGERVGRGGEGKGIKEKQRRRDTPVAAHEHPSPFFVSSSFSSGSKFG
jgi:hypothetical protein